MNEYVTQLTVLLYRSVRKSRNTREGAIFYRAKSAQVKLKIAITHLPTNSETVTDCMTLHGLTKTRTEDQRVA